MKFCFKELRVTVKIHLKPRMRKDRKKSTDLSESLLINSFFHCCEAIANAGH
jgi:hypothetical protein